MKNILPTILISFISFLGLTQTSYYVTTSGNISNKGSIISP